MADHKSLAAALAAFQAEVPKMSKDETAKVKGETKDGRAYDRSYGYAGLEQFVEIVEPALGKHGMSVTSRTTFIDGMLMLEVKLLHESGEFDVAVWPLPDPRRSGPQDIGSSMTYGRRYLGWGLTGTFPGGVDDDGHQAQATARERWEDAQPRSRQQEGYEAARAAAEPVRGEAGAPRPQPPAQKRTWTDAEVQEQHGKLETLDLTKAVQLYDWMGSKGLHARPITLTGAQDGGDPLVVTATDVLAFRLAEEAGKTASLGEVKTMRHVANDRGLLKTQVSATEDLNQALIAAEERLIGTENANALRDDAAASWDPRDNVSPESSGSSNG